MREPAPETRGVVIRRGASLYDLLSPAMLFWQESRINRRAVSLLNLEPSDRVLDLGCATGGSTLEAAHRLDARAGGKAVGVDASPEMIARARRKARSLPARFELAAAERLPFPDASFTRVLSTFFFHHLNADDKLAALREARRVLAPGGLFVLVDVDVPRNVFGRLCANAGAWLFRQPELDENIRGLLPTLFAPAGFPDWRAAAFDLGYITTFVLRG